jgi:hypothetical protein
VDECVLCSIVAGRVARLLRGALGPAGVNLVHATGVAAWQSMFCFHLHVVPRWRADELQLMWQEVRPAADAELADLRRRVLAAAPSELAVVAGSGPGAVASAIAVGRTSNLTPPAVMAASPLVAGRSQPIGRPGAH